ncbi:unnamed protein product [Linum tenue]|uniref:Protein cornichon homolog 1 n=1 Tax=Linum tenue TaxID=586396 RepID=A0AAV0HS82_9ROSI|nr:unnamed protein product [Linum tenue]
MASYLLLWMLFCVLNLGLLAIVFHAADQLDPFEATARVNKFVLPEFILQWILCFLFLVTGHWVMVLISLPIACFHLTLYLKRKHLIDVTEVFRSLDREKKQRVIKLGIYLVFLCITIFRLDLHCCLLLS